MSQRQSFIKGALILTAAGFSVRFIGLGFRIVLGRIIGDEGIGLYQTAYPVYSTLLALSTAGIPIAISKLVSQYIAKEDYRGAYRVFSTALNVLTLSGLVISVVMFWGAQFIADNIIKDPRAFYPIAAISPAVFFVTIMSSFRGFFQGQQRMLPTAISQIFEQFFRVGVTLLLVVFIIPSQIELTAAGATFGATAGAVAGLLVLMYIYSRDRKKYISLMDGQSFYIPKGNRQTLKDILYLSLPITLSHLVIPLQSLIDLSIVPDRLQLIGFNESQRMSLYGQLTGYAGSIVHIPQIITVALAISLMPAISKASAMKNDSLVRSRTSLALRLSILLGLPSAIGMFILAEPIMVLIYNNAEAGKPLSYLSFAVIFIALYQTSSAVLQGLGKVNIPLINLSIGAVIKVVLNWYLVAIPALNINGAAIASVIGFSVSSFLNLYWLKSLTGLKLNYTRTFIKPTFAVVFMGLAVYLSYTYSMPLLQAPPLGPLSFNQANAMATFGAICIGIISYGLALFTLGALDKHDLIVIPRVGPKILAVAQKLRLIK